jgi:hypothetical protein
LDRNNYKHKKSDYIRLSVAVGNKQRSVKMANGLGLAAGIVGIGFLIWLVIMAVIIGSLVFWVLMLVDVIKRKFPKDDDRILWILIIALAGIIGAIIYYFVVKIKDKRR